MKNPHSDKALMDKLERLRENYRLCRGQSFETFFCPILGCDEPCALCKGHIVPKAFRASPRRWTVQRADVDNFYGTHFESEFAYLTTATKSNAFEAIIDKALANSVRPNILLDGQPVEYYHAIKDIPSEHTRVILEFGGKQALLGFKIAPEKMQEIADDRWAIAMTKDFRLSALVSLLKAGYLTMFELLGYKYGCGAEGNFMGPQMLGRFFLENRDQKGHLVRDRARGFFSEYSNMVRPAVIAQPRIRGTVTDDQVWLCGANPVAAWGIIVFIRTDDLFHAVLMPLLQGAEAAAQFDSFLRRDAQTITVTAARFLRDRWLVEPRSFVIDWPAAGLTGD